MTLRRSVQRQFAKPHGILGRLAGWIMAARPSNRARGQWTLELLGVRPGDRVLEVGCGPGVALAAATARSGSGMVVGLDRSPVMLAQARRRNRAAIAAGQVQLVEGDLDRLPDLGSPFDRIFSVNVVQFLGRRRATFAALREALAPGGTIVTTYMPRHPGATRADALAMAEDVRAIMAATGFDAVRVEELPLKPVPAIAVIGNRPRSDA